MDLDKLPQPSDDFHEAVKSFEDLYAAQALLKSEEKWGPLSAREKAIIHKVATVTAGTIIQTLPLTYKFFNKIPVVKEFWRELEESVEEQLGDQNGIR